MKTAVVFDASGTLLGIKRIVKNVKTQKFLCNCQTVDIVDMKKGRSLIILKENPLKVLQSENPDKLISDFLNGVKWGISYCNPPINKNGVLNDVTTKVKELQDPLNVLKRFEIETDYGSAIIVDTIRGNIEYTIATGGYVFSEAYDTIKKLEEMGVSTFIASGDSKLFIEKLGNAIGVENSCLVSEAHHNLKKDFVINLKNEGYKVIMVGDASNDVPAMIESDLSVVTLQNGNVSKIALETAKVKIENISEIIPITKNFLEKKFNKQKVLKNKNVKR
ncbi:Haloacid dehalogenase domain protein hydrolase [Methanococcus vannielii SB]|uniref:Haloacid dehalogenase domain protein hydrolase n=1 Tax=Methanococcus vannielii (strain ATCC 35089 / DSM 1224 / JCM 13029 / OCM 148 / SB) TaxID=406327 RepID=A6UQS7_METVS|nr:HAD family hydrolase [Methanococcus vannielii]ABR54849.1 Haloacid dehalogenase domain protein hydrolase [Methanococcus vannielii SB]